VLVRRAQKKAKKNTHNKNTNSGNQKVRPSTFCCTHTKIATAAAGRIEKEKNTTTTLQHHLSAPLSPVCACSLSLNPGPPPFAPFFCCSSVLQISF
jgi:hypothetical protein